jgi:leucyl aminopeptidase
MNAIFTPRGKPMNFIAKSSSPIEQIKSDCLVVGVYTNGQLSDSAQALGTNMVATINALFANNELTGKTGQTLVIHQPNAQIKKIVLLGFGDKTKVSAKTYRNSISSCAIALSKTSTKKIDLYIDDILVDDWNEADKARYCAEKFIHSFYRFTHCKSDKKKKTLPSIYYHCPNTRSANAGIATGIAVGEGMNLARELGNLPGNICTPRYLALEAKKLSRTYPSISTKILSEKQMAELGMGSLLSVSAGSDEPAQFIIMEYKGAAKTQKPHVLVGKGITFDTGGISIKPGPAMDEMKYDMCGAASVFGTMHTIGKLAPKINIVGIVAAAENMPSGGATKPGDIVTSMSGKTIEVLNTDAEGRLVLCDALSYAERYKPQSVIDIATLTGACVIALGSHATGLFSNDDSLAEALLTAGNNTDDRAWHMPLWEEYKKQLKSNFADLANIGGREGGSITAACFLSYFTEKYSWAHLDIAGTAWLSGAHKGATGRPVPLLTDYLLSQATSK